MLSRIPAPRGIAAVAALAVVTLLPDARLRDGQAAGPLVPGPSATLAIKANETRQIAAKPLLEAEAAAREADHVSRFDSAIAPSRDYIVSDKDADLIADAVAAYAKRKADEANTLRGQISDAAGRKLIDWYRLRSGLGTAAEVRAFQDANPAWPDQDLLQRRYEEALFGEGGTAQAIKTDFKETEPENGVGFAALASAYLAEGNEAKARELAQRGWREFSFPNAVEAPFLQRFGKLLTEADHKWRFDRLLIDEVRWASERNSRVAAARRLLPLLGDAEKAKAEARLAVFTSAKNARKLMAALPAETAADWGLAYQRVQHLRRLKKNEDAWKILLTAPTDKDQIVSPDGWWLQRRAAAYGALQADKYQIAFDLVRDAGPLSTNPLNDQTFLAGWIAFRYLNDPKQAQPFFSANEANADGPLSRARALYWLGRTEEALKNRAKAAEYFRASAAYGDTFHGHLSREKLGRDAPPLTFAPPTSPTRAQINAFNALDAVQATVIAAKSGLDARIVRAFIRQLNRHFETEAEVAMVAHLAEALGDTQMAVRVGKSGIARGLNLLHYSYPIHAFPAYEALREPPEPSLLLGLARQESEFNGTIMSGAGARGILQVMPITARHVCRDYKIKCDIPRLMRDPSYNAMLASAYVGDRMADVNGSYILALTSYNAGPGRTRQWLRQFGDPRDPKVDPIDWIHRIPFEETRDYVQKVLSNVQIYRARLGDNEKKSIAQDLTRARRVAGAAR